jgi:hypothetical protein
VILTRIFLGLVPALMALLLVAGMVEHGATLDSGVGLTSDGPSRGPGSRHRVLAVRTVLVAGIAKEQDNKDRPTFGPMALITWVADRGAGDVIAMPSSGAGPRCVRRCAMPPRGPPLA